MKTTSTTATAKTTTDVPVTLRCLACAATQTIMVASRGRLVALTNPQRLALDEFVRTHQAAQVAR